MTQHQKDAGRAGATLAWVAAVALAAAPVLAIDLGAARLKSAANAPLEIDIVLLNVGSGELESLKPQLPANSRSPELSTASIELVQGEGAAPVLRLRTMQPVATNEIRFVVVADWGRGRKFREYNLSLTNSLASTTAESPPAVPAKEPAAPPPPASTTFSTSTLSTSNGGEAATAQSGVAESAAPSSGLKTTRIVRTGETLMSISREWSARTGTTLAQTMLGIFQANPQAFGARGMNELLVGAEIVLPEAATLASNSPAAAAAEIGRVLGIWRTSGTPSASAANAAAQTAAPPAPRPVPAAPTVSLPATPVVAAPAAPVVAAPAAPVVSAPAAPVVLAPAAPSSAQASAEAPVEPVQRELAEATANLAAATSEIAALQARLAAAEQAAAGGTSTAIAGEGGFADVRRLAGLVWWSSPLLLLTSLGLLLALLLQRRRRATEQSAVASDEEASAAGTDASAPVATTEMSFELPPIKASRASEGMPDVLLGESPRVRRVSAASATPVVAAPPVVEETLAEDLEGDPPPVDEAGSKIDLARAFIEMGHHDAAILELQAALRLGDETQRAEALRLLDSLPKS